MRVAVVVGLALLSSVAAADGIKQIAAPDQLVAKPLEVGRWVVDYGDGHASIAPVESASMRRRPTPMFIELGMGYSGLSGVGAGRSNRLDLVRETLGFVAGDFDIVTAIEAGDTSHGDVNPSLATKALTIGAGARLWPLGRTRGPRHLIDPTSLFVQVTGGYSHLENMTLTGDGVGAAAAVGWQLQVMRDWASTVQVFDDVAYENGNVGFRNVVGVTLALELWIQ